MPSQAARAGMPLGSNYCNFKVVLDSFIVNDYEDDAKQNLCLDSANLPEVFDNNANHDIINYNINSGSSWYNLVGHQSL
jgi:hypothetical protein